MQSDTILNPYISVELRDDAFQKFCSTLRLSLQGQTDSRHAFEATGLAAHVSIAYAQGEVSLHELRLVAQQIASERFMIRARGFEILHGEATGYDYLALDIEISSSLNRAQAFVKKQIPLKEFAGGFRGHVSLLKAPQIDLIACQRLAALAKGLSRGYCKECFSLNGDCVCVFTTDRELIVQVPFATCGQFLQSRDSSLI